MSLSSLLLAALVALTTFSQAASAQSSNLGRTQGSLTLKNGKLQFRPCNDQRSYLIQDTESAGLYGEARTLLGKDNPNTLLFADLGGQSGAGTYSVNRIFRLQKQGPTCSDPNFRKLIVRAFGSEPFLWTLSITNNGLILERPNEKDLVAPYVEEQLPQGLMSFNSEANGQNINIWVSSGRCLDAKTGVISDLHARLQLNDQTLTGCAYYGSVRD